MLHCQQTPIQTQACSHKLVSLSQNDLQAISVFGIMDYTDASLYWKAYCDDAELQNMNCVIGKN
jgi:hypothetical protein